MDPQQKQMLFVALEQFGQCDVRVEGSSMWPSIRSGNSVRLIRLARRPRPGEAVAFFQNDQLVVHRVIGLAKSAGESEEKVRTRGDSFFSSIVLIPANEIIGRAKGLCFLSSFLLKRTPGRCMIFLGPILAYFARKVKKFAKFLP